MKFHATVLFVKEIGLSKNFYTGFLGFSIVHDFGKNIILSNGLTLWEMKHDHIISKNLKTLTDSNSFELYFEINAIETIQAALENAGIKFLHHIHEETWGQRTLRFFDPDNHLIEIGEPLEVFVNNLNRQGLSPINISKKTGIPLETVMTLINN